MATEERIYSDLAIPPGELLAEELEARGMSQREFADRTGRPEQKISEIINGKKAITHDTALEFEKVLGISAAFWVNLESSYQLAKAKIRETDELDKQEEWLAFFPIKELQRRGFVSKTKEKRSLMKELLKFFGVASFPTLKQREEGVLGYRVTPKSAVSHGALYAWLREGELRAHQIDTSPYDERRFLAVLSDVRALTLETDWATTLERMTNSCAEAGVALVVIKEYPKSGASGVARWLSHDKAMIQLSTKRRYVDMFWFSFFHEAKHILDRQRKRAFVNKINDDPAAETDADLFASDFLIPPEDYRPFAETSPQSYAEVQEFAAAIGIHPEVVVGRLQHDGIVPPSNLNRLRRRFTWAEVSEDGGEA